MGQSYRISDYFGRYMLSHNLWTLEEKLPEVPCELLVTVNGVVELIQVPWHAAVTTDDLQSHIALLLSKVNMRILVNGNLFKDVSALFYY